MPSFMSKESAAKYRRTAATLNYLALDNPLIAFASKEASRSMRRTKARRTSEIEENTEILAKRDPQRHISTSGRIIQKN